MSAIDDIRKEVVQHLLEIHYKAKERGDDFFFTVGINDPYDVPFFLQEIVVGKALLKVSFYGSAQGKQIVYLLVADNRQVFMVIKLDAGGRYDELGNAADQLRRYDFNYFSATKGFPGHASPGEIESISEIIQHDTALGKVDYFLVEIKPVIDECVSPLKNNPLYKYLFLNEDQFEKYIQSEPAYESPQTTRKIHLRLISIRVTNFRGIKSIALSDLPVSARWIVLTGENGFGKTSVLQAIAAGLYGNFDESGTELVPKSAFVGVSYQANDQLVNTDSKASRQESADKKLSRELATYGSSRLQVSAADVTKDKMDAQLPSTYNLFNVGGLLLNVEQLLKES